MAKRNTFREDEELEEQINLPTSSASANISNRTWHARIRILAVVI